MLFLPLVLDMFPWQAKVFKSPVLKNHWN